MKEFVKDYVDEVMSDRMTVYGALKMLNDIIEDELYMESLSDKAVSSLCDQEKHLHMLIESEGISVKDYMLRHGCQLSYNSDFHTYRN